MTTYNTGNPIGSAEVKDLYDNAENLDIAINSPSADVWTDRLGQARKTWRGIQNEAQLEIAQVVGEVTAQSQQYLDASIVARDEARAAASASGPIAFYGTYAAAQAAVGGLPDGGIVEVSQDETRVGARTRYKVQAGALVFVVNLDQTKLDLAAATGASLVGFQQEGTGAVPRTVQSKLRETVSVWDYFLAVEADHTGMFDRATAAAARVHVPAGNYTVHKANFPANTEIFGDGEDRTIITQRAGATAEFIFTCDSGSPLVANNITGLRLHNLQLRGTCDTDGFSEHVHLLNLNGVTDVKIRHVKFKGFRGDGIYLGSSNTAGVERHNERVSISRCTFDGVNNANRNAISVIDGDGITIEGCHFENTTAPTMPGAVDFEPNNDAFAIIRNVTVRHNSFKNIGGNVGCIAVQIPPAVAALCHNITIENNRSSAYSGTGFMLSANTSRILGTGSEDNNIKIVRNKGAGGAGAFNFSAVKGLKLLHNEFTDFTQASNLGGATAITGVLDALLEGNTLRRCGSTGGNGVVVGTGTNLKLLRNKLIDCGTGVAGASNAIIFAYGTSASVSLVENAFEAPAGKTLVAIQKGAAHTFTAATNTFSANVLNGLSNAFQWGRGDTKQVWLPVVAGGTTAGTCTYSFRMGSYLRVGNVVHFSMSVGWTGHTGTGQITVSLPVAPSTDVNFSPVSLVAENVGYSAGGTPCALVNASGGFMAVYQQSVGGPPSAVGLSPASGLYISGSYMVG